jgi:hypothetical protein
MIPTFASERKYQAVHGGPWNTSVTKKEGTQDALNPLQGQLFGAAAGLAPHANEMEKQEAINQGGLANTTLSNQGAYARQELANAGHLAATNLAGQWGVKQHETAGKFGVEAAKARESMSGGSEGLSKEDVKARAKAFELEYKSALEGVNSPYQTVKDDAQKRLVELRKQLAQPGAQQQVKETARTANADGTITVSYSDGTKKTFRQKQGSK